MTTTTERPTATGIATPDTSRKTFIGWDLGDPRNESTRGWNKREASRFRLDDSLYLKKEVYYQHLDNVDAGLKNGPKWWNQAYFTAWSNQDLIETLAGNLELLPRQQGRAVKYFMNQDLRKWGLRKELVAWAICAYVVHSDEDDQRRAHPKTENGEKADQFWDAAYHLDLSMRERVSTYHKVQADMETRRGVYKPSYIIFTEGKQGFIDRGLNRQERLRYRLWC